MLLFVSSIIIYYIFIFVNSKKKHAVLRGRVLKGCKKLQRLVGRVNLVPDLLFRFFPVDGGLLFFPDGAVHSAVLHRGAGNLHAVDTKNADIHRATCSRRGGTFICRTDMLRSGRRLCREVCRLAGALLLQFRQLLFHASKGRGEGASGRQLAVADTEVRRQRAVGGSKLAVGGFKGLCLRFPGVCRSASKIKITLPVVGLGAGDQGDRKQQDKHRNDEPPETRPGLLQLFLVFHVAVLQPLDVGVRGFTCVLRERNHFLLCHTNLLKRNN